MEVVRTLSGEDTSEADNARESARTNRAKIVCYQGVIMPREGG